MMFRRLKNERMACVLVLSGLFVVQFLMHLNCDNLLLDDWVFAEVLDLGENPLAFLANRWQTWSSRLLIEGVLVLVTHSIWAWRLLDCAAMTILAYGLYRLAGCQRRPSMLCLSAMMVTAIPFAVLRSTGWMATSVNYYWPLACTVVALIPLADALWRRKTHNAWCLAAGLLSIFGANQEQMAAVIVSACLVLGVVLYIRDRRICPTICLVFAIALTELVLHLSCPGNALRAQASVAIVNLRDYGQFSLVDKLSIGLTSTATLLFFTYCPLLLVCWGVVTTTVWARRRGAMAAASLLPVLWMAAILLTRHVGVLQGLWEFGDYTLKLGPKGIGNVNNLLVMGAVICALGVMALSLYLSIGHRPLAIVAVLVFAIGFGARMALSFSPTVVESGERTMLPLYGAMILCALLCARDCRQEGGRRLPLCVAGALVLVVAGLNVAGSFALAF